MPNIAIRAEDLAKRYRIGKRRDHQDTLRDHLAATFRSLLTRLAYDNHPTSPHPWLLGADNPADLPYA